MSLYIYVEYNILMYIALILEGCPHNERYTRIRRG